MVECEQALSAGGGIRTLKPLRAIVFENDSQVGIILNSVVSASRAGGRSTIAKFSSGMRTCFACFTCA